VDFNEVTLCYRELEIDNQTYYMTYKGILLGRITTARVGPNITLTFTPDEKYK